MPPMFDAENNKMYDSVVANVTKSNVSTQMHIIYADKKSYPQYLISYK
jgi:hypothetical protein